MDTFHFVKDYERLVSDLVKKHPIDEAMSLAVGGDYESVGDGIASSLIHAGLRDGDSVVDLGCGSGRVATARSRKLDLHYLGTDVVDALLKYAKTKCPLHYQFVNHRDYSIPATSGSVDYVFAFSLNTHLLPEESFLYLRDSFRALKPGGLMLFTYLDVADSRHHEVFLHTANCRASKVGLHINTFLHKGMIDFWCEQTGFEIDERNLMSGFQSVILLRKPANR